MLPANLINSLELELFIKPCRHIVDINNHRSIFLYRFVDTVNMESKSAKKNKKRHNKKKPESHGTKKKDETSPEFMLEALKVKLAEAKESQVQCKSTLF